MLCINAGIGFRLSDPRICVHETAVWNAHNVVAPSIQLLQSSLPKRHAEWLLAGSSVYRQEGGSRHGMVDWPASVKLDRVKKSVSCRAALRQNSSDASVARLAIDACNAAAGSGKDNPLGIKELNPPLQLIGALGTSPSPLAGMGVLGNDWPQRKQWAPRLSGDPEVRAADGTHMGWPGNVDFRYFQQAAPDQWKNDDCWNAGAPYLLSGFREDGHDYAGHLPRLVPVVFVNIEKGAAPDQVSMQLQTIWFLPDQDIGVMWWHGQAPLKYALQPDIYELTVAFKDETELVNIPAIASFASQRRNTEDFDPECIADHPMMPATANGWTWEVINNAEDHPQASPAQHSYEEICMRLEQSRLDLVQASADKKRLLENDVGAMTEPLREIIPKGADRDWREYLSQVASKSIRDLTIRGADLRGLELDGWQLDSIRLEHCQLGGAVWSNSVLNDVSANDCSFEGLHMHGSTWANGVLNRCNFIGSQFRDTHLEKLNLIECRLGSIEVYGGKWETLTVQGGDGADGKVHGAEWNSVSWCEFDAPQWELNNCRLDRMAIVESQLIGLKINECVLGKFNALTTDFSDSKWTRIDCSSAGFLVGTSLERATLTDCMFRKTAWMEVQAGQAVVDHCSFLEMTAEGLQAQGSHWSFSVLDGIKAQHASFNSANFQSCSLKGAILFDADWRDSVMKNCNLIKVQSSWSLRPPTNTWRGNLEAGHFKVPERIL